MRGIAQDGEAGPCRFTGLLGSQGTGYVGDIGASRSAYQPMNATSTVSIMVSFIRNVSFDCSDPYALAEFWSEVIGPPVHPECLPGDTEVVIEPVGGPRLFFQAVAEGTTPTASCGPRTWRQFESRTDRPVLVGWSYGAFVRDYVRTYGRPAHARLVEGAVVLCEPSARLSAPASSTISSAPRRRPTHQHRGHALVRAGVRRPASAGRRPADGGALERGGAGCHPRQSGGPRITA